MIIMIPLKKLIGSRRIQRSIVLIISFAVLYIIGPAVNSTNHKIENVFTGIRGEAQPDSNIIIIHVSENDIDKLGWPLKRNYYALLINKLKSLHVKVIGLEVFLSENVAFQTVYNELLNEEISKAGDFVLASLAEGVHLNNSKVICDSILYPEPKKQIDHLKTGHLNFLADGGIFVPRAIESKHKKENSISSVLAESFTPVKIPDAMIKINFISSWKRFTNFSLIEFFNLFEQNEGILKPLAGKMVLIGVSDPSVAKSTAAAFDDELPGVALHAFAVDNLLNNRGLKYNFINASGYLFFFVFLITSMAGERKIPLIIYAGIFLLGVSSFYILYSSFYIELNYSVFFFLLISLTAYDLIRYLIERKAIYSHTLSEAEILKRTLSAKEENLKSLQTELDNAAGKTDASYIDKIEELKKEIEQLKKIHDDEEPEQSQAPNEMKNFEGMIYSGGSLNRVIDIVKKAAPSDATILITGESGSGKELVARAVHNLSERKKGNFVAVNCAALTETLLESELFGHVKGAFTNAMSDREGRFEYADKGTIFLDEIGETSENFQAKLLRVIQSGEFEKVGSPKTMHSDARIVAATNKNLEELVNLKKFRQDLYYRLNVIRIEIPPLRERKEDIRFLARYFVEIENPEIKISKSVIAQLMEHEWKGNVRELQSVMKRALIFVKSENRDIIKLCDLPAEIAKAERSDLEKMILDSLREKQFSHSSINETAKELGDLSRTIISENFRGIFFKNFIEQNFDFVNTVKIIAGAENTDIIERVNSKCGKYLSNLKNDLKKISGRDFETVKSSFSSKYKNLPKKYHRALDDTIKFLLND